MRRRRRDRPRARTCDALGGRRQLRELVPHRRGTGCASDARSSAAVGSTLPARDGVGRAAAEARRTTVTVPSAWPLEHPVGLDRHRARRREHDVGELRLDVEGLAHRLRRRARRRRWESRRDRDHVAARGRAASAASRTATTRGRSTCRTSAPARTRHGRASTVNTTRSERRGPLGHVELSVARNDDGAAIASPNDGSSPGQTWRPRWSVIVGPSATTATAAITAIATDDARDLARALRERRARRQRRVPARRRRGRRAGARRAWPPPSTRAAGSCRRPRTTRGGARRAHRARAAPRRRAGSTATATRSTPSSAGRPRRPATPSTTGKPARLAAIAPTAPSATRDGNRDDRATATRAPRASGTRRGTSLLMRGRPRRASPRAAAPGSPAPARASRRPRSRASTTGAETGPARLARATPERAARGERRPPDARGAARGVARPSSGVAVEIDDERDADRGGRLVLAHDQRPAARARRPVHEPRRVAGHVRAARHAPCRPRPGIGVDAVASNRRGALVQSGARPRPQLSPSGAARPRARPAGRRARPVCARTRRAAPTCAARSARVRNTPRRFATRGITPSAGAAVTHHSPGRIEHAHLDAGDASVQPHVQVVVLADVASAGVHAVDLDAATARRSAR